MTINDAAEAPQRIRELQQRSERTQTIGRRALRLLRTNPPAVIGIVAIVFGILVAVSAPVIAPHDPIYQERSERLASPGSIGSQSGKRYILGTDALGRDVLSRVIYGARISFFIGFLSVAISAPFGVFLGLLAGYYQGKIDDVIMRIADIQLAFPFILFAMAVIGVIGANPRNIVFVLGISGWVLFARVVRSDVLTLSKQEFVAAARVAGAEDLRILFRHILPNVLSSAIVLATFAVAYMILAESSLSFLGLGVNPPTPAWGSMLSDARGYISTAWWISVFPGLAIMGTVLSVNFVGDWIRDALDPRQQVL